MKEREHLPFKEKKLTEHCGLAAIFTFGELECPVELVFTMVRNMATRGQEGFGILGVTPQKEIISYYQLGRVWQIPPDKLRQLNHCQLLIAHNRYSTKGSLVQKETLQPFSDGHLILAHNGEIVNLNSLKKRIEKPVLTKKIDSDSGVLFDAILNSPGLNDNRQSEFYYPWDEKIIEAILHARGAFSLILGTNDGVMYAGRDPWGFRPLFLGKIGQESWAVASETVALELIGAKEIQNIRPGYFLKIDNRGAKELAYFHSPEKTHFCSFEVVYFLRPESYYVLDKEFLNVAASRVWAGRILARNDRKRGGFPAELVVPINDSGRYASQGYAFESGLPVLDLFSRNRDASVGRVFIQNTAEERRRMADYKQIPISKLKKVVSDYFPDGLQRVILVDDSIVRGDTSRDLVRRTREILGLKEVHLRIASPPVIGACHLGIDTEDEELIALKFNADWEKIAEAIGADSVAYLTVEELEESLLQGNKGLPKDFCTSCFTRDYFFPELMKLS